MKRIAGVVLLAMALAGCEDVSVNRVEDGERVVVKGHKLRLHQVDAPEVAEAKCDAERAAGELTIERLQGEFLAAKELEFQKTGMACLQFMWCDAFVKADGNDVGDMLIAEGLAVRSTSTEAKLDAHDWCAAPLTPEEVEGPSGPAADANAESGLESVEAPVEEAPAEAPVQEEIESRTE
jgi:endonuclease YncB( thermonuclease family)